MLKDKNLKSKEKFLEYYKDVPMKKYAAAYAGKSEDTFKRYEDLDKDFADLILLADAEFMRRKLKHVRNPEWILERKFRREFAPPQQKTDITSGGKPIPILGGITNVQSNNSNKETSSTE